MPVYGPTSLPPAYTANAVEKLSVIHPSLHEVDRQEIRALWAAAWGLNRPLVINGNMDWFQRSTGVVTSTTTYSTTTSYAADRFFVVPAGASVTQQRSTTVPDIRSQYSLQLNGAASVTTVDIGQRIEAAIVNTRGHQQHVFSCYVQNVTGAIFTPSLLVGTPGAADNFTTVTNRLTQTLQACADSAWTQVSFVFDPSAYTNLANGLEVKLRVPSGNLVSGDVVRIAQFDLRPGGAAGTYVPPDPRDELARCVSYFRIIGIGSQGAASATTKIMLGGAFGVPMRAAPAFALTDTSIDITQQDVGFFTSASSTITDSVSSIWGYGLGLNGFTGMTAAFPVWSRQDFATANAEL